MRPFPFWAAGTAETGDKAENASLNQLQITARPELPPKSTPEIFLFKSSSGYVRRSGRRKENALSPSLTLILSNIQAASRHLQEVNQP